MVIILFKSCDLSINVTLFHYKMRIYWALQKIDNYPFFVIPNGS